VISYCAKDDEVQTRPIIERALEEGKRVAVIVTDVPSKMLSFSEVASFTELAPGQFGILEPKPGRMRPISIGQADVVLVPLVAWDERGHRLGYGAGYFDRALAGATRTTKVGLALESQRLAQIPESTHDVPLDIIVTEKRVLRPAR
jgi:5-formyltetrahydrofolate cyclo-ligase